MAPLGRPIGIWIAVLYLLALGAFAVIVTLGAPTLGRVVLFAVILLPGAGLLLVLSRWAILPIGVLAVLQVSGCAPYLVSDSSRAITQPRSDIAVYEIQYNAAPLIHLAGTLAVLLYTTLLWRAGILR